MSIKLNTFKLFSILAILAMTFSNVKPAQVQAQSGEGLTRQVNAESGRVSFITPADGKPLSAARALGASIRPQDPAMALAVRYAPEFGLQNPERSLTAMDSNRGEDGRLTVRFQQNYENVPVMGGELIVNTNDNGDLYSISGEVSPGLSLTTQPAIDAKQARETALRSMAKWLEKTPEDFTATDPELWIYDESLLQPSTRPAELVWRMEVRSIDDKLPVRELVLVDAMRGGISLHFNQIDTAWAEGTTQAVPASTAMPKTSQSEGTRLPSKDAYALKASSRQAVDFPGTQWYVATTGVDTNDCKTPLTPCGTINAAIGKAATGDTIRVAVGTYTGTGYYVVSIGSGQTLAGGWDSTFSTQVGLSVLDGQHARTVLQNGGSTIDHFMIANGFSTGSAGGISSYGLLTLNNSVVMNNHTVGTSTGSAGGITAWGNVVLNNSTIRGNISDWGAAGILIESTNSLTLNNSTITENKAAASGGGIMLASPGAGQVITINNSTIVNNSSGGRGGGIYVDDTPGIVKVKNSIIANNESVSPGADCFGTIDSLDHSLIDDTVDCTIVYGTGNHLHEDPMLSRYPVGLYAYHVLNANSPAVDAGLDCTPTDQRGIGRPQGSACDIGAYEYSVPGPAAMLGITFGANQRTAPSLAFASPLGAYVMDEYGSPVAGVQVTFTAPESGAGGTFAETGTNIAVVITDDSGLAVSPVFTANAQPGAYTVTATASGLSGSVDFSLLNVAWFVSPSGSDTNSCASPEMPCQTINAAINKAVAGDTIRVAQGTYTGSSSPVVNITKSVILSGGWDSSFIAQNGISTVDGAGYTQVVMQVSGVDPQTQQTVPITVQIERFILQNGSYGIFSHGNTVTVLNTSILNNHHPDTWYADGAGINTSGTMRVVNSTISGNITSWRGGGIYNQGSLVIENSTISGNTASIYGGGAIYNTENSTLEIYNSTIVGNMSKNSQLVLAGGIRNDGTAYLANSILSNKTSTGELECSGTPIVSLGFNIVRNDKDCPFTSGPGDQLGTSAYPLDPALTPLQDNGGLTFTHLPLANSPAVNGGNPALPGSGGSACLGTDQRGAARPDAGRCDIGAVEGSLPLVSVPWVRTYTAKNGSSLPGTFLCDQSRTNCTNNTIPHADGAHKYALGIYAFLADKLGRNSINNNGMTIVSTVNYCDPDFACPYDNAYWSGKQMVYGGRYGFPLADDVVAHELFHGVTDYESSLFYYYQSGAINESLSDLWGEYYDQSNGQGKDTASVKWLLGEDVSGLGATRSMSNPPAYGDPDKMTSTYYYKDWKDSGGVHKNSGINNKAVYLLVDGGTFNGITVSAIGWERTVAIYYEVNTRLLTSGADYSDLYYALQTACTNLIGQKGITSKNCTEVRHAVDAVQMNKQPVTNFNSDAPLCGAGQVASNVFFDDMEVETNMWDFNYRWQYDSPYGSYAHSGNHFLYADDYPAYRFIASNTTVIPITLPPNAFMVFHHAYDFESYLPDPGPVYFDGGVLEYSTDYDVTWQDAGWLMNYNKYNGRIASQWNNPLKGRSAFVDSSHGYISTRLNLNSLAGKHVNFRWLLGTDDYGYQWGWWMDDVRIYTCETAPVISGNVGIPGVVLSYIDGTTKTVLSQADGSYSIPVPYHWSGTVTPSHPCYTFTPPSYNYKDVTSSQVDQDYASTEKVPLCVWAIQPAGPSPTGPGVVSYTVTFTKPVTGVDVSDFVVTGTDLPDASLLDVSGTDAAYTVRVSTGLGVGELRLDLVDDDSIVDGDANFLGGIGKGNGTYRLGTVYTVIPTFVDVSEMHPYYRDIEILYANGLTGGCSTGPLKFCPDQIMNRGQAAVFILRANFGSSYVPPVPTHVFKDDWSKGTWAEGWAEGMRNEGISAGCLSNPLKYCPWDQIPREQAVIFGLRMKYGTLYTPPPATGTLFADMTNPGYYATSWAEQAYKDGIIPNCGMTGGKPNFCPKALVSRGLAAYMIVRAKNLTMP